MQSRHPSNIKVIDVSHHNTVNDWAAVKASGVKGVFIKATEGKTYIDPDFAKNVRGAQAVGLKVGFYHYARPENNAAADEIKNFLMAIKSFEADLPHVLDVEGEAMGQKVGAFNLTVWSYAWLSSVQKATGHRVAIYTGASFSKSYLGTKLAMYPLWVAHYGATTPAANDAWPKWMAFQYTSDGQVPGISGRVDMNEFDLTYWNSLFAPAAPTPAPKPTPIPAPAPKPTTGGFSDVPYKHWAASAIKTVDAAGIMSGHTDGTFKPDAPVTRAELAAVVERLLNK